MIFSRVLMVICLLTVINVKLIKTSNSTKCHSLCVCLDSTTVDCSNRNLTSAPDDLPSNTTLLLLNYNQIESLSPGVFYNFPHLTRVNLSGNKIKCDCSLSWVKNTSINLQFVAICQSPSSVRGRSLANLTVQDMCKRCKFNTSATWRRNFQPQKNDYEENDIVSLSCPQGYVAVGPTVLKCLDGATWNVTVFPYCKEIPSTTSVTTTTFQSTVPTTTAPQPTTTITAATTIEKAVTSEVTITEVPTTTVEPQTTRSTIQTTNTGRVSTVTKTPTTIKVSDTLPTYRPNATSSTLPTDWQNRTGSVNLTSLVEKSNERELDVESLRNLVEMLESDISTRNYSDITTTKNFLLISSNVMRNENRKTWSKLNENFHGVERLLKAVNKAMRLQATEMLKLTTNYSQPFFVNYSNLEAEIQVATGEKMAEKEILFPSSRLPEEEYIQFPGSGFKEAGKNKVAVVSMKSAQLGELLPRRSLVDDFDNFRTGSGVLSATILSLKEKVTSPVTIKFQNKRDNEEHAKCVFWKHENTGKTKNGETSSLSRSGWSDEGCEVVSRNKSTTICHCDHMTDFAVITRSIEQEVVEPTVIIYIAGFCVLIGALIALIRNVVVWRETRRERLSLLIHECLAFILIAVVFLLGLFLDYHQAMCMIFAALLHCFVLAVFCWILAEFVQLYLCINYGWNRSRSRLKYFAILGWVVPLFLVGVTLAITRQNEYGSTQWCWYSDSQIILLTYVCPIVLCILVSIIVSLKIVCFKCDATDDSEKKDVSVILVLSGLLTPLALFTFTTAALSADRPGEEVFQYVFAVFCIILALYITIYHCWLDREIVKLSVRKNVQRARPKRDYYSTKETVMYSEGTSEGKSFSLIFPSRKSPTKKPNKSDKRSTKRSDSSSPFDYDSTVPMYPSINDSSLKSFKSQVSTQQHTLDTPPNTSSAITISRPNSQCIELASLSDLDRRPDGAEQTDAAEPSDFYGSRHSNPLDSERQRTSGCSTDLANATTFGKEKIQKPTYVPNDNDESKNRNSGASSAGISRTSRSSVSGASLTAPHVEENGDNDAFEQQPFIRGESDLGPEIRSDPPAKIPKRRKRGSRRRLDDELQDDGNDEPKIKTWQNSSSLPLTESSIKLKQYTSF